MIGPSYLGLVQWAVAPDAGDDLAALAIQVSASQFHGQTYQGGSLALETAASWLVLVAVQERRLAPLAMARALRRLRNLFAQLPIGRPRRARDRRRGRVVPRGAGQPGPRGRLLGRPRLRRRRRQGGRAGTAHRRLARHLAAVDARGLRRAAGRRARAAARHRPVDPYRTRAAGRRACARDWAGCAPTC